MTADMRLAGRMLGTSAGDYVELMKRELDRVMKQTRGNRLQAIKIGLQRLREADLITPRDFKRLQRMAAAVLLAERGPRQARTAAATLARLHEETSKDPEASTMGATMVGVAYRTNNKQVIAAGGLFGMVLGAVLTGSPWGAVIGGLVSSWLTERCGDDD
jgi:hypothetical protein